MNSNATRIKQTGVLFFAVMTRLIIEIEESGKGLVCPLGLVDQGQISWAALSFVRLYFHSSEGSGQ